MRTIRYTFPNYNMHLHNHQTNKAKTPKVLIPDRREEKPRGHQNPQHHQLSLRQEESHTTFRHKAARTAVRWVPVRKHTRPKLVLIHQNLLLLLGKALKGKNNERRIPLMPLTKDTTTIQVNHLNSPLIQIGTQKGAAKEKGNSGEEMISGDIKVEEGEGGISNDILADGSTVEGTKHLFPWSEHLRAGHSVGFTHSLWFRSWTVHWAFINQKDLFASATFPNYKRKLLHEWKRMMYFVLSIFH